MRPIGGYFELERGTFQPCHAGKYVNSGRNALRLIVRMLKIRRLHVPYFTCPTVPSVIRSEGCDIVPYELDARLQPAVRFPREDFVLVNDYFGVTGDCVANLADDYPNLIVDNAQSYFATSRGRAAFYSPRKFFGLPDGGIAVLNRDSPDWPELEEDVSYGRMAALLKRHDLGPSAGYPDFRRNSESLAAAPVRGLSRLTRALMSTIDEADARNRRLANFAYLHERLGTTFPIAPTPEEVPLVYPLVSDDRTLRRRLIEAQVFVATYWPGCERCDALVNTIIPLPIDQRYGVSDMARILEVVRG